MTQLNQKYGNKFKEYKAVTDSYLPESVDWRTGGAITMVKDQVFSKRFWFLYFMYTCLHVAAICVANSI